MINSFKAAVVMLLVSFWTPGAAEDKETNLIEEVVVIGSKDAIRKIAGSGGLIEEKELNSKLLELLKNMSEKNSLLTEIANKQGQYSDKSVYENIDKQLEILINEKY